MDTIQIVTESIIKLEEVKYEADDYPEDDAWSPLEELETPVRAFVDLEEGPVAEVKQEPEDPLTLCNEDTHILILSGEDAKDSFSDTTSQMDSAVGACSKGSELVNAEGSPNESFADYNLIKNATQFSRSSTSKYVDDQSVCVNSSSESACEVKMTKNGERYHECSMGKQQIKGKESFIANMLTHSGESPREILSEQVLDQQETANQKGNPYQCSVCFVTFITKERLTEHYKTHMAEEDLTCNVCKGTFHSMTGLVRHCRHHTNNERSRFEKEAAESEDQKHTGEKPFQCQECKKRFSQKTALVCHQRLHSGERPYACRFCQKTFNSKAGKEVHERIHTGERPYKCGDCDARFRCSANLWQHTKTHSERRPFACELCRKPFRRREGLQVHIRTHTGERPFACPACGRRFTRSGDRTKHAARCLVQGLERCETSHS